MKKEKYKERIKKALKYAFKVFLAGILMGIAIKDTPISNITAEKLSYSEILQLVSTNQVQSIELYSNDTEADIILKGDKSKYITTIPNEEVFCEYIQENISSESELEIIKSKKVSLFWRIVAALASILIMYSTHTSESKEEESEEENGEGIIAQAMKDALYSEFNTNVDFSKKFRKTDVHFADVAGLKEEKAEVIEIIEFLKNPEKYTKIGARIPKGVLLSGAPGTGKTLLAKAIAGEADVPFLAISAAEIDGMLVGAGANNIRKLFETAKENAPCIVFIDEIDSIGQRRFISQRSSRYDNQTIEQLLTEMDGFDTESNIIVIAATNQKESLDKALIRPGRFDRCIEFHLPDVNEREEILKVHAKNKKFMENVKFSAIAHDTAGFSGAELENILNEAALIAVRKDKEAISNDDIEEALKKVIIGLQKKGRTISSKEKHLTAYHEAGHAIISKLMPTQDNVKEISIIPRGSAGGYTWHETVEDKSYISKKELTERLAVLLGGRAAEKLALEDISTGASNDLKHATQIARNMICVYGMNDEVGPISLVDTNTEMIGTDTMNLVVKHITQTIKDAEDTALKLLKENESLLDMVARELLLKETISGKDLDRIYQSYKNNPN